MSHEPIHLTQQSFEKVALNKNDVPVIVDFWATWCAPCRMMEPVLAQLAREMGDQAVVAKVNVDDEPALAQAARVQAIPTLVVLKNGRVEEVLVGMQSKERLKQALTKLANVKAA